MLANLSRDKSSFGVRIECLVVAHTIAGRVRRPEILAFPLGIVLNHRARYIENCLSRTIVLFKSDDLGVGKMFFKVEDVRDVSAAPFVDRLVLVAYDTDVLLLLSEETDEG